MISTGYRRDIEVESVISRRLQKDYFMNKFTVIKGNPEPKTELPFIIRFDNPSLLEEAEAWEREEIEERRRASNVRLVK